MKMKFLVFCFSLCSDLMILDLFRIDKNVGIQIWHVNVRLEEIEKVDFFVDFNSNTFETYIVLEIKQESDAYYCSLFYWIGSKSPMIKRQNADKNAALLRSDLLEQIQNAQLIFFGRAIQGYESENFCFLFGLHNRLKLPKLYRVLGSQGYLVCLLPLPCNRFYINDPFVLNDGNQVTIWMAEVHPEKARTAILLAEYIVKVDLQKKNEEITNYINIIDEILRKKDYYEIFLNNFLKKVSKLERGYYPNKASTLSDSTIEDFLNTRVELFEYSIVDGLVFTGNILIRPLLLSNFESKKTYVMKSSLHIFIYLGKDTYTALIQLALAHAENASSTSTEHFAQENITIVREGEVLPTNFLVHFADEMVKLRSVPNKSKLFEYWMVNKNYVYDKI